MKHEDVMSRAPLAAQLLRLCLRSHDPGDDSWRALILASEVRTLSCVFDRLLVAQKTAHAWLSEHHDAK